MFSHFPFTPQQPTSHQPQFQLPSSFINRSRPSSAAGSESPLTSTLTSTTTNQDLKHTPGKGKIISLFGNSGSIKKKAPKAPKVTTTTSSITTPTTSLVSTRQGQYSVEEKPNESHSTSTAITTANQNESPSSVASSKSPSSSDGKMSISRAGRLYLHSRATSDTSALMQKVTQWKDISAELAVTFKNDPSSETKAPSSLKPSPINVPSPLSTSQALNRSTIIGPPSIRSPHHGYLYGN